MALGGKIDHLTEALRTDAEKASPPEINFTESSIASAIGSVPDFVKNGISHIVSDRTANAIYERYCVELAVNISAVMPDAAASAAEVRSAKPVLFLAILAAASGGVCDADTQKRLRCLTAIVLSHCFPRDSEYTLELVQAAIVSALWHTPAEFIEGQQSMDMQQLSHHAANIGIHIGLGKQTPGRIPDFPDGRYGQNSPRLKTEDATDDLQARRTWLGCYFICAK